MRVIAITTGTLLAATAVAQSIPNVPIPSQTQVNQAFQSKRDYATTETGMFSCPLAASGNIFAQANQCISLGDPTQDSGVYAITSNVTATTSDATHRDRVALYGRAISQGGTDAVWGLNTVTDVLAHSDGTHGAGSAYEADIDNTDCDAGPSPGSNSSCPVQTNALWATGVATYPVTDAFLITASNFAHPQWHYGIQALGASIDTAFLDDTSNAQSSYFIAGTHQSGIDMSTALFEAPGSTTPGTGAAIRLINEQYICFQSDCGYKLGFNGPLGAPAFLSNGGTSSVAFPAGGGITTTGQIVSPSFFTSGNLALGPGAYQLFQSSTNQNVTALSASSDATTINVVALASGAGNLNVQGNLAAAALTAGTVTATGNAVIPSGANLVFTKSDRSIGTVISQSIDGSTLTLSSTGTGNMDVQGGLRVRTLATAPGSLPSGTIYQNASHQLMVVP